jgi:hypothetical protein
MWALSAQRRDTEGFTSFFKAFGQVGLNVLDGD